MTVSRARRVGAAVLGGILIAFAGDGLAQTDSPPAARPRPLMLLPPAAPEKPAGAPTTAQPPILRPSFSDSMPLPGPPSGVTPMAVEMDMLGTIDPDSAGTLADGQGGFARSMWSDTPRGVIGALLPRLPVDVRSAAARDLTRRLLLSAAEVPLAASKDDGGGVILRRVRQLARMGAAADALALIEATPARASVKGLARVEADIRLAENDLHGACGLAAENIDTEPDVFWQKTLAFCQALAGDRGKAALGLGLLREQGEKDADYFALMEKLVNDVPVKLERMAEPTSLKLAIARVAKVPLPADVASQDRPAILRTVATSPYADIAVRLDAAERAEASGAVDVDTLRSIYASVEFGDAERTNPISSAEAVRGSRARALLYRTALAQDVPTARAEVTAQAMEMARDDGRFGLVARVFAPVLSGIAPSTDLSWFAAEAVRAMLVVGDSNGLAGWLELLRAGARHDPAMAKELGRLRPVLFLAGAHADPNEDGAAVLAEWWRGVQPGPERAADSALLLSAFEAFVGPLPGALWEPLLTDADRHTVAFPQPALWFRLESAAGAGRLGETVLISLMVLGGGGLADVEPVTFSRVLGHLRGVGLEAEARALAVEAALAVGI